MNLKKIFTALTLGFAILGASVADSAVPKTKADHTALAEKYGKMAADQDAIVKEHTEMKKDYRSNQAMLPKQTREKSLAELDAHCDAIIGGAKKLADEYRAMAQWHEMRAEEFGATHPPKTAAEHRARAEKYERMAADQEAVVAEHREMKTEYRSKWFPPKQIREKALADMDKHCDAIISSAKKLADEYKAMAQWHKLRAEEFQK